MIDFTKLDSVYSLRALENTQEINYKTLFLLEGKIEDVNSGFYDPVPTESALTDEGKEDLRKQVLDGLQEQIANTHHAIEQCAAWLTQLSEV